MFAVIAKGIDGPFPSDASQGHATRAVFGGTGRCNQGDTHHRNGAKRQGFGHHGGVDGGQKRGAKVVVFWRVRQPSNCALIGQASLAGGHAGKLAEQGTVVKCFFHGRTRQAKRLPHEVAAEHGGGCKGRAAQSTPPTLPTEQPDPFRPEIHACTFLMFTNWKPAEAKLFCLIAAQLLGESKR